MHSGGRGRKFPYFSKLPRGERKIYSRPSQCYNPRIYPRYIICLQLQITQKKIFFPLFFLLSFFIFWNINSIIQLQCKIEYEKLGNINLNFFPDNPYFIMDPILPLLPSNWLLSNITDLKKVKVCCYGGGLVFVFSTHSAAH